MSPGICDRASLDLAAQRDRFICDGYLVEPDRVGADLVRRWCRRSTELMRQTVKIDRQGDDRLFYTVLTGDVIREEMDDLYAFYASGETRSWVAAVTGEPEINVSSYARSAINVNILRSAQRYRWHFDANPYIALLYLSDHAPGGGGELELYPNLREGRRGDAEWDRHVTSPEHLATREKVSIRAAAGMMVLLDGSVTYHRVAPLMAENVRVSVPLVYLPRRHETRPADLDDYLYGTAPDRLAIRANSVQ